MSSNVLSIPIAPITYKGDVVVDVALVQFVVLDFSPDGLGFDDWLTLFDVYNNRIIEDWGSNYNHVKTEEEWPKSKIIAKAIKICLGEIQ